jgi:lipopolysaccharide export system permease protein
MRLVDRYILREISESWIAVGTVLLLILIGNAFLSIFRKVGGGDIPADAVAPFLFTYMIRSLVAVVPFSLYLGILIGIGRLYRDSEMAALAACGIGGWRIYRPALILSVPAVLVVGFVVFYATPWAAHIERAANTEIANRSELAGVGAGRFNESRDGNTVYFVAELNAKRTKMNDVFVHGPEPRGESGLETARYAAQETQDGARYVVMYDGVRYIGTPGQADYKIIEFAKHGVAVPPPRGGEARLRRSGKSLQQLLASTSLKDRAELEWRIAVMISVVVLVVLAVPLSHTAPRQGRYARLAIAVLVYVPYRNLLAVAKNWLGNGETPPWLGIWWAHVPVLLLAAGMMLYQAGYLRPIRLRA